MMWSMERKGRPAATVRRTTWVLLSLALWSAVAATGGYCDNIQCDDSFDHIAIDEHVHACDIAAIDTLDDDSLDLAIFCLSLMGSNFTDYIREAHRLLRIDGDLHIWEPASYFADVKQFCSDLEKLGFEVLAPRQEGLFMRIRALKTGNRPAEGLTLSFRGRGG